MKNYKITAENSKLFILTNAGLAIGTLEYDNWFSFNANVKLADQSSFQVEPKGFWGTTIEVKNGEQVLLNFRMNWKSEILIHSQFAGNEGYYIFKQKSLLKTGFILLNGDDEELMLIKPNYKWKKFSFDYEATTTEKFEALNHKALLLLIAAHCANYFITIAATAAAM